MARGDNTWNKGKTKDTDKRIADYATTYKTKLENGEIIPAFLGRKHTLETKKKQSSFFINSEPNSLFDVSGRTMRKILQRLQIACSCCGWNESSCDLHHIVPRSKGGSNEHTNLTVLCPNCHRKVHSNIKVDYMLLSEQIGDTWKQFYFAKLSHFT